MNYYEVLFEDNNKSDIVCHYDDDLGVDYSALCRGREYDKWNENFTFFYDVCEGNNPTDYLVNDKGWFLVSQKLKCLLETINTKIQFLPVNIVEKNSKGRLLNYYVANIIVLADALCLEECDYSIFKYSKGDFYSIKKFAVYTSKINGLDVFKLDNGNEIPIFVSEKFVTSVRERGITGMEFLKIKSIV